jgi:hypothetical protein
MLSCVNWGEMRRPRGSWRPYGTFIDDLLYVGVGRALAVLGADNLSAYARRSPTGGGCRTMARVGPYVTSIVGPHGDARDTMPSTEVMTGLAPFVRS